MGRIILAAVLGTVVLFAWNFAAWTVLPLHMQTIGKLADEAAVAEVIRSTQTEGGAFFIPGMAEGDEASEEQVEIWTEAHRSGPVGFLVLDVDGSEPMPPIMFIKGGLVYLVAVLLAAGLLVSANLRGFGARVLFVLMLGVFVGVVSDLGYWNWMYFPLPHTVAMIGDHVVGWLLVGLLLAAMIKPGRAVE